MTKLSVTQKQWNGAFSTGSSGCVAITIASTMNYGALVVLTSSAGSVSDLALTLASSGCGITKYHGGAVGAGGRYVALHIHIAPPAGATTIDYTSGTSVEHWFAMYQLEGVDYRNPYGTAGGLAVPTQESDGSDREFFIAYLFSEIARAMQMASIHQWPNQYGGCCSGGCEHLWDLGPGIASCMNAGCAHWSYTHCGTGSIEGVRTYGIRAMTTKPGGTKFFFFENVRKLENIFKWPDINKSGDVWYPEPQIMVPVEKPSARRAFYEDRLSRSCQDLATLSAVG